MIRSASRTKGRLCRNTIPGPVKLGVEQTLSTEEHVLKAADELDVVVYAWLESDQATGIDAQGFIGLQGSLDDRTSGMNERLSVTG